MMLHNLIQVNHQDESFTLPSFQAYAEAHHKETLSLEYMHWAVVVSIWFLVVGSLKLLTGVDGWLRRQGQGDIRKKTTNNLIVCHENQESYKATQNQESYKYNAWNSPAHLFWREKSSLRTGSIMSPKV